MLSTGLTIKQTVQNELLKYLRENYKLDEARASGTKIILDGKAIRNAVISKEMQDSFSYKVTPKLFSKWAQECVGAEETMKDLVEIRHICRYRKRKPVNTSPISSSSSSSPTSSVGSSSVEKPPTPPVPLTEQQLQLLLSNPKAVSPPVQQPISRMVRARGDFDHNDQAVSYLQKQTQSFVQQQTETKQPATWESRYKYACGVIQNQRREIANLHQKNNQLMHQMTQMAKEKASLYQQIATLNKELSQLKHASLKRKRVEEGEDPLSPLIQPPQQQKRFSIMSGKITSLTKTWGYVNENLTTQLKLEEFQEGDELQAVVTDRKTNKTEMFAIGLPFSRCLNVNLPLGVYADPTTLSIAIRSTTMNMMCPAREFEVKDRVDDDCFAGLTSFQLDAKEEQPAEMEKDIMKDIGLDTLLKESDDFWLDNDGFLGEMMEDEENGANQLAPQEQIHGTQNANEHQQKRNQFAPQQRQKLLLNQQKGQEPFQKQLNQAQQQKVLHQSHQQKVLDQSHHGRHSCQLINHGQQRCQPTQQPAMVPSGATAHFDQTDKQNQLQQVQRFIQTIPSTNVLRDGVTRAPVKPLQEEMMKPARNQPVQVGNHHMGASAHRINKQDQRMTDENASVLQQPVDTKQKQRFNQVWNGQQQETNDLVATIHSHVQARKAVQQATALKQQEDVLDEVASALHQSTMMNQQFIEENQNHQNNDWMKNQRVKDSHKQWIEQLKQFECAAHSAVQQQQGYPDGKPNRVALVIGVSDYQKLDLLRTSVADGNVMKKTLESMDYNVHVLRNPQKDIISQKMAELNQDKSINQLVVHYSGHGVGDYICPTGFDKANRSETGFTYQEFVDMFPQADNTMVFLDCCNSNRARRCKIGDYGRKIHVVAATAQDKCLEDDFNGLLTRELSEAMRRSHGKSFEELFAKVQSKVKETALRYGINQTPLYFSIGQK